MHHRATASFAADDATQERTVFVTSLLSARSPVLSLNSGHLGKDRFLDQWGIVVILFGTNIANGRPISGWKKLTKS
jgi:hypothetical protein